MLVKNFGSETRHSQNNLTNPRDFIINIHFANGGIVKSKYIGNYIGLINDNKIVLNDVLYVPSFKRSLVSIDHLNALNNSDMELWHRRMGHFNIDLIKEKLKNIKIKQKCKICSSSKLKNFPYKSAVNHTTKPFELIHMDLVFVPDYSLYGNKYFLSILDDYTRYG
eukprot:jgi/Orpsp1_1/1182270/evm.model.c7180000080563.1